MTERSYPFDGSQIITQDDYSLAFMYSIIDGVCGSPFDTNLLPTANGSANITLPPGEAFVRGQKYINSAPRLLSIPANSGGSARLDYVLLRCDPSSHATTAIYAAGGTMLPTLNRSFDGYTDVPLGAVTVPPGATVVGPPGCVDARWFTGTPPAPSNPAFRRPVTPGGMLVEGNDVYVGGESAWTYLATAQAPDWSYFTPVWTADSIINWGSGATNIGAFHLVGKTCDVRYELRPATNPGASTNPLAVTLPFTARTSTRQLLTAHLEGNVTGDNWFVGCGLIFSGGSTIGRIRFTTKGTNSLATNMATNEPINFQGTSGGTQDILSICGSFEIA